jgi:hypothetical protein
MNPDIFYKLEELPTPQDRLDRIGEYYAKGKRILEGIAAHEVAETLGVDVDGLSPISQIVDWKFTAEPNSSPEESDLDQEMAQDVVSHLQRSDIDRGRLEELEKMAKEIDNSAEEFDSVLEKLGLSEEEILKALRGARESILEGDAGWKHVATLRMKARNGWVIEFTVIYDDCDQDVSLTMYPSAAAINNV